MAWFKGFSEKMFLMLLMMAGLLLPLHLHAQWNPSGEIDLYARKYALSDSNLVHAFAAGVNAELKLDRKSKIGRFRSELQFWSELSAQTDAEKAQATAKNFYLENSFWGIKTKLGMQTLVVDGPDFLNPADVIHAKNWTDPASPKLMGSLGILFNKEYDSGWQCDLFFIPTQSTALLPGENSPWWPREKRLPIESADVEIQLPQNVQYKIGNFTELSEARKNNLVFRVLQKSESYETQILLYEGLSQDVFLLLDSQFTLVATSPKQILLAQSPLTLKPLYYRQQVLAGTFVLPLESFLIKAGANWQQPLGNDSSLPAPSSTFVIASEKNFDSSVGLITLIVQYQAQKKFDKNQVSFLRSIFENAVTVGLRVPWGDDHQILGGLIYDLTGNSSAFTLNWSKRLSDSWAFATDLKFLQGPESTLLGLYDHHDHLNLSLKYRF